VEYQQELAHGGDQGGHFSFSRGDQPVVVRSYDFVVLRSDESRHVERTTNLRSPAPNHSLSSQSSTVAIDGGQANELGCLATTQGAELRQVGQERRGGDIADTGNTGE